MFRPRRWTNTSIKLAWRVFMSIVKQQNTVHSHKIKQLYHICSTWKSSPLQTHMDYIASWFCKTTMPSQLTTRRSQQISNGRLGQLWALWSFQNSASIIVKSCFSERNMDLNKTVTFCFGTAARKSPKSLLHLTSGAKSRTSFGRVVAPCWDLLVMQQPS